MNNTSSVFKNHIESIVVPTLKGGLGNQMFQISTAYAYSRDNNISFGINYGLPTTRVQGNGPETYQDTLYSNIYATSEVPEQTYNEPDFSHSSLPQGTRLIIDGYFQSPKYFDNYKDSIGDLFTFSDDIKEKVESALSKIPGQKVGVHIRRGDYKMYSKVHPPCPVSYYESAMNEFSDDATFIVCTDDIPSFKEEFDVSKFVLSNGKSELEDLYLLSQCDSVIICNSTFSWWGAYLGNDKEKVIAPASWFGPDGPKEYEDIYVDSWLRIDNT